MFFKKSNVLIFAKTKGENDVIPDGNIVGACNSTRIVNRALIEIFSLFQNGQKPNEELNPLGKNYNAALLIHELM